LKLKIPGNIHCRGFFLPLIKSVIYILY